MLNRKYDELSDIVNLNGDNFVESVLNSSTLENDSPVSNNFDEASQVGVEKMDFKSDKISRKLDTSLPVLDEKK